MTQTGAEINGIKQSDLRDKSDTLSTDGLYQVNRNLELYGRFALRFNGNGNNTTAYASALTYQAQMRAQQRLSNRFDVAAEGRWLAQPSSNTFRRSFGAEAGFWVMPDLRLGGGYNFTQASQFNSLLPDNNRQFKGGFYFTVSTKLSNVFNLFGTSNKGLSNSTIGDKEDSVQSSRNKTTGGQEK
jgi:hypothetical protein